MNNIKSTLFKKHLNALLILSLCLLTISVYWPVKNYPFINFDDGLYVSNNSHVQKGLSLQNIIWAFSPSSSTGDEKIYWHPLTWLSLMIDYQLFGLNSNMYHMENLFFHLLNSLLLFLIFSKMTGATWKSFFLAALFALHPINVDSTAWIAERKNLLSTAFWMMAMLAYVYYAKRPSIIKYLLVFFTMAAGLLAKPMIVTLPCVLLLMDYWPLYRIKAGRLHLSADQSLNHVFYKAAIYRLVLEKIPLLILSLITIGLSMTTLHSKAQVINKAMVPMPIRIENALVSYIAYLYKTIWPRNFSIFYPFPATLPLCKIIGAALLLASATIFFLMKSKKQPYLIVGWLWYLGVLFPVIGLVQGGLWPAMADRWAYVPLIGIFIMISWGIPDFLPKWKSRNIILSGAAACIIILLFLATRLQLSYWKNTDTLFTHALAVTNNNYFAYNIVGMEYVKKGETKKAKQYFLNALNIKPNYSDSLKNLGRLSASQGQFNNAINYYNEALMLDPQDAEATRLFADALRQKGETDAAIDHYNNALALKFADPQSHNNLGVALFSQGRLDQAEKEFKTALGIKPGYAEACHNLGLVESKRGNQNKAMNYYKKAIRINPDYAEAHRSIGDVLFSKGNMVEAFRHYSAAAKADSKDAKSRYNIGVILYMQNRPAEAARQFQKAIKIDPHYEKAKTALIRIKGSSQN